MEYFFDVQIGDIVNMIKYHIKRIEERCAIPKVGYIPYLIPVSADSCHRMFSWWVDLVHLIIYNSSSSSH
jgi:hypothetical protein